MPDVTAPGRQVADLAVVWLAQALPLVRLVTGRGDVLDMVLLALRLGTLVGIRRAYCEPGAGLLAVAAADVPVAARAHAGARAPRAHLAGPDLPDGRRA